MKVSQTNTQLFQPPINQNGDSLINSLKRAKEKLSAQMQKLNQDKDIDEAAKQSKLKQLQIQMEELEQQIQKRQMEKLIEDSKEVITESSNSSSDSFKTEEEKQKEAGIAMNKSLISASTDNEHLKHLSSIRNRLISEDGGISERVKRTENMMSERTSEIQISLKENQRATQAYTESSKKVEEKRRDEKNIATTETAAEVFEFENDLNEQTESSQTNDTAQTEVKIKQHTSVRRKGESTVRQQEHQQPTRTIKTYEPKIADSSNKQELHVDISL